MKLKLILIVASLLMAAPGVVERAHGLGLSAALVLFCILFLLMVVGLIAAALVKSPVLRWMYALILASGLAFSASFSSAMGQDLTYDAFTNMWSSRGFIGDAFGQFGGSLVWGGLQAVLLLLGIGWPPRVDQAQSIGGRTHRAIAVIPGAVGLMLAGLLYVRGGEGAGGLPGAFVSPAYAAVHAFDSVVNAPGPRQPVRIKRTGTSDGGDIVLIVDESIAANYLDINSKNGVYSGLGTQRPGVAIHNFGVAASITHCSVGSNLTLRFGGTRSQYRAINATSPSIWSYAKAAGYVTVYIDAQRIAGQYQNDMDADERRGIDRWVQFDTVPVMGRDPAVARTLADFLNDGKPQFIFVNKSGAHFPVNAKYPENQTRYAPATPRSAYAGAAEKSARDVFDGGTEEWRHYRNAYRNAVKWNVGAFFDVLFARATLGKARIIYTSDHGQNLHERETPGDATHCTPEPVAEEGAVPLVLIEGKAVATNKAEAAKKPRSNWAPAAAKGRNASSHYQIFPTVLGLMGFDRTAVLGTYGAGLDSAERDPLTFNAVFNARLGREPTWKKIEIGKLAQPPVTDYSSSSD